MLSKTLNIPVRYIDEVDSIILIEVHDGTRAVKQGNHTDMKDEAYLRKVLSTNKSKDECLVKEQMPVGTREKEMSNKSDNSQEDKHEEQDLLRKAGDISLYVYYFRSIGWLSGITFLGTNVLATVGVMFPRE